MGGGYAYGKPHKKQHRARKDDHDAPKPKPSSEMGVDYNKARCIGSAIWAILHHQPSYLTEASPEYAPALALINDGVNVEHPATECIQLIDAGLSMLAPALAEVKTDPDGKSWLDDYALGPLDEFRERKRAAISAQGVDTARQRVENATVVGGQIIEVPDEGHPHERAAILRAAIPKLIVANEGVLRSLEEDLSNDTKAMLKIETEEAKELAAIGVGGTADLQSRLYLLDSFLMMTDDEFLDHLHEVHGFWNGVATYAEFVKMTIELVGGLTATLANTAAAIARATGDTATAALCGSFSNIATMKLGDILAAVELVHGVATLLDSNATRQDKVDAAVQVGTSGTTLLGSALENPALGAGASAVGLGYAELKMALELLGATELGINAGYMSFSFTNLKGHGESIGAAAENLAKAKLLLANETDKAKAAALEKTIPAFAECLKGEIMSLRYDLAPRAYGVENVHLPGGYGPLVDVMSPIEQAPLSTQKEIEAASKVAIDLIMYTLKHFQELVEEATLED